MRGSAGLQGHPLFHPLTKGMENSRVWQDFCVNPQNCTLKLLNIGSPEGVTGRISVIGVSLLMRSGKAERGACN